MWGNQTVCERHYMACIIKQLGTSAIPRSSRTKIKKMKVNLAFPLRQADVTGFQSDTASENGGRNIHEWEMHWNFILLKKKKKGGMLWKMMFL